MLENYNNYIFVNSFPVSHGVLESEAFKKLSPSAKVFYMYLAKLMNRFGKRKEWFWRSCRILAKDTGLTEKTIRAAKKQLVEENLIEVKEGKYDPELNISAARWYRVMGCEDYLQHHTTAN